MEKRPTLKEMEHLAREAGEILRAGYGKRHDIRHKGITDLVTEVDHQSEELIIDFIRSKFPEHSINAEESGAMEGNENCWYVDPLDGTVNYAHDIPFFCVSIAYAEKNRLQMGVIYEPLRDECFTAEVGKGAWLNGELISVSKPQDLIHSLLVTGFPYSLLNTPNNNLDRFTHMSKLSQGVRRLGSAALDMAYVACGRFDGYWEVSLKPWDLAAGTLLVREAGGIATQLDGSEDLLAPPYSVLVAGPVIYPLMKQNLDEIRPAQ